MNYTLIIRSTFVENLKEEIFVNIEQDALRKRNPESMIFINEG